jgi:tetratricopeptide (TPR) repeat protein
MHPPGRWSSPAPASNAPRSPRTRAPRSSRSGGHQARSGFEIWLPLNPLYEAGEYAEAADRGRELIEENPEVSGLLYNVACCESLAGRTADAIEHLRSAIERSERFRSFASGDSDFDPIREEPAFKELMG